MFMLDTMPEKCKDCFWFDVSLKTWQTFECKAGIDKEQRIKDINSTTKTKSNAHK